MYEARNYTGVKICQASSLKGIVRCARRSGGYLWIYRKNGRSILYSIDTKGLFNRNTGKYTSFVEYDAKRKKSIQSKLKRRTKY